MELFGLSLSVLVLLALVVFGAAIVKGTTGFGFGLVASPLLVLMMDAKLAVAFSIPIQFAIDLFILSQVWRHLDLKRVVPIVVSGAAGIPLGTMLILAVSSETLRVIVLSVVVVSGLVLLFGYTIYIARERLAGALTGFLSGVLYSGTSMAGPPMVIFMVNQRWEKYAFRSSLSAVSVCLEALTLISFGVSGVIRPRSLGLDLVMLPVVLLSFFLSYKLVARINADRFRRIAIYVVIITGVVGLAIHFLK